MLLDNKYPPSRTSGTANQLYTFDRRNTSGYFVNRKECFSLAVLTIIAALIRFWKLGDWSFWADEVFTTQDAYGGSYLSSINPLIYFFVHLSISIFGVSADVIADLIDPLVNQVCRVNINSQCQRGPDTFPFTGRKDSAEGTLSVSDALRVFSIRSLVAAKDTDPNKKIINEIVKEHKSSFLSTEYIL